MQVYPTLEGQLDDNTMASSNRRAWPFALKWPAQEIRPSRPPGGSFRTDKASLLSVQVDAVLVGYILDWSGTALRYVLDNQLNPVYLEDTKFYGAGEGSTEHSGFPNRITDKACRAEEFMAPYKNLETVNKPLVFETNDNTGRRIKGRTSLQTWRQSVLHE
ncbi:hypothetical protein X797_007729 [Metarhizium robertsii]|uniref:Uncharacterized protein n=1 Tax=Metarhizium robertsii TaxID=568076 RepID=A0A014N1C8_9HYPO|nr:hypothetical protein X797_007729 [Metarhizium robertsii]